MTVRTTTRALALLAGAIVVAACGGGGAPTAPGATQAAVATSPPATQAPAASDGGIPSFALPSFHGDVDLEKLIPTSIGGEVITTLSMTGADFVGSGSDQELTAVLTALGKQPADLSVAFGGNTQVQIIAFQVNGVPGTQILNAFYTASQTSAGSTITDASFGGKAVKKIQSSDATEDPSYVYTKDDVVFTVGGTAITDALLTEAFSKLP